MPIIILMFAVGILMGSTGGLLLKLGATQVGAFHLYGFPEFMSYSFKLFSNWIVLLGFVLYFGSAVIWTYLLVKLPISFVQPILALTYVLTPILAVTFLDETVPTLRWVGILIIVAGVIVVARTAK